jgi:hypothetical protein
VNRDSRVVATLAATIAIGMGVGYIVDCRRSGGNLGDCWITGQGMINRVIDLGAIGGAGYVAGYWTLNPKLHTSRKEEQEAPSDPLDPRPH